MTTTTATTTTATEDNDDVAEDEDEDEDDDEEEEDDDDEEEEDDEEEDAAAPPFPEPSDFLLALDACFEDDSPIMPLRSSSMVDSCSHSAKSRRAVSSGTSLAMSMGDGSPVRSSVWPSSSNPSNSNPARVEGREREETKDDW